ncbi:hypothetical protein FACS1894216_02000 [Synergistales bacterium]|nr:hypothetical protein FACS1894216_02000 [Synergistales bacterium]
MGCLVVCLEACLAVLIIIGLWLCYAYFIGVIVFIVGLAWELVVFLASLIWGIIKFMFSPVPLVTIIVGIILIRFFARRS